MNKTSVIALILSSFISGYIFVKILFNPGDPVLLVTFIASILYIWINARNIISEHEKNEDERER